MNEQSQHIPVITIDGPAGSGKGTISQRVADQLGWHILDSGALYRLVGLAAQRKQIDRKNIVRTGIMSIFFSVPVFKICRIARAFFWFFN